MTDNHVFLTLTKLICVEPSQAAVQDLVRLGSS